MLFFFGENTPWPNHSININSPNFFITNFNDMKRMNLIRAALFAVFAFMGTVSLSAQQSWLDPAPAIVVINNELAILAQPPAPSPTGGTLISKQQLLEQNAKSGCTDCLLKGVKYQFLTRTLLRIKSGESTGPAVEAVRGEMIQFSNGNANLLATIQQAYEYMTVIL